MQLKSIIFALYTNFCICNHTNFKDQNLHNQRNVGKGCILNKFDYNYTYHNYYEIVKRLKYFKKQHLNFTQIVSIGKSTEGRKIVSIILNNEKIKINKKIVIIECGIHAREWISTATCSWISNQLVSDKSDKKLLNRYEFMIIPSLNPDGYEYTWSSNRLWRKSRSKSKKSKCIGNDLNRNWNISWCGVEASDNPCQENYCGDSPFSEPEILCMKKFLRRRKSHIFAYFSLHSFSQLWLYPLSYENRTTYNNFISDKLSEFATNAIRKIHNQSYRFGSIASTIAPISGTSVDWVYKKLGVELCFVIELRDNGTYGFLLPPELIKPTAEEVWSGIKTVIQ